MPYGKPLAATGIMLAVQSVPLNPLPLMPAATIALTPMYGLQVPSNALYSMFALSGLSGSGQHTLKGASLLS